MPSAGVPGCPHTASALPFASNWTRGVLMTSVGVCAVTTHDGGAH
jgi:hypothetical protein